VDHDLDAEGADFVRDDVIDARQKTAESYPRHKGLEDRMESKAAKRTNPLGRGAEKLPKANPQGGTALREKSAVQAVVILPRHLPMGSPLTGLCCAQATPCFPALGVASERQQRPALNTGPWERPG
jgi:hypothetical protein